MKKLNGTPKQIDWATQIRFNVIGLMNFELSRIRQNAMQYDEEEEKKHSEKRINEVLTCLEKINNITEAVFFIEYFKKYSNCVVGFPLSENCVYTAQNLTKFIYKEYTK